MELAPKTRSTPNIAPRSPLSIPVITPTKVTFIFQYHILILPIFFLLHMNGIIVYILFLLTSFIQHCNCKIRSYSCMQLKIVLLALWYFIVRVDHNFVTVLPLMGTWLLFTVQMQTFLCMSFGEDISAGCIHRNRAAGSQGKHMFSFSRFCQTLFQWIIPVSTPTSSVPGLQMFYIFATPGFVRLFNFGPSDVSQL